MITTAYFNTFFFVLMRMSGCVFMNPFLGRREIPAIYKVGLSVVLAMAVTTFTGAYAPIASGTLVFIVELLKEFLVGYVLGFVITLFSYVISFGGEIMDMQMGMSMAKVYDPSSNVQMSLSATIFNLLFMLLFFAANGHITMIRIFLISGNIVPYGQMALGAATSTVILDLFCQCTVMAVKFAIPIIAIELLVEMGVGIIMKAVPQINVFVVNIQAKMLVGIILIALVFAPFAEFLERLITLLFGALETVLLTL